MKPILFILPVISLILLFLGLAIKSAGVELEWLAPLLFAIAAGGIATWVAVDFKGFKAVFGRKGAQYGASSGLVVILGTTVIIGLGYLATKPRFNKNWDVTRDSVNTLSDQTDKIIALTKKTESPIKLQAFFVNEQIKLKFGDLIALYQTAGLKADIEYFDPQANPTVALANKVAGDVVIMKSGDREQRITIFTEEKITNAFVNVLKDKTKKVYFIIGHGEGSIDSPEEIGFSLVKEELEANKYSVENLSLLETGKIPEDADMIVLAGPKYDFKAEEVRLIESYLEAGGSTLAMLDALIPINKINGMISKFGVQAQPDLLLLRADDPRAQMIGQNNAIITDFDDFSPISRDFAAQSTGRIITGFTRTLTEVENNIYKLKVVIAAKSSDQMMRINGINSAEDLGKIDESRVEIGSYPVIAVSSGLISPSIAQNAHSSANATKSDAAAENQNSKESRLVVVGSSSFANNAGVSDMANKDMFMNIVNYLLQDEDFISIRATDMTKSTIDLSTISSQLILMALAFIYPFLFLGFGGVNWIVRKSA